MVGFEQLKISMSWLSVSMLKRQCSKMETFLYLLIQPTADH